MPRFVLLLHETPSGYARATHWDLMLERGAKLRTFALAELPERDRTLRGEALADHRPEYLTYEGLIAGGRGSVRRCDSGTYEIELETDARFVAFFHGTQITGRVVFEREAEGSQFWLVSF